MRVPISVDVSGWWIEKSCFEIQLALYTSHATCVARERHGAMKIRTHQWNFLPSDSVIS